MRPRPGHRAGVLAAARRAGHLAHARVGKGPGGGRGVLPSGRHRRGLTLSVISRVEGLSHAPILPRMTRPTPPCLSAQAARLALVAAALVLTAVAGAQSSGDERAARAAARELARSQRAMDPAMAALLKAAASEDSVTRQKQELGREVFRDSSLSQPAGQ